MKIVTIFQFHSTLCHPLLGLEDLLHMKRLNKTNCFCFEVKLYYLKLSLLLYVYFIEGSRTYHQGFAACIPSGRTLPSMGINVSGSVVGPNASVSFYESGGTSGIQPSDPSVAYRGSVLSSTTVSSNHEELMQAYEYGRKHQLKSCLTLPSNTVIPPHLVPSGNLGTHLIPTHIGMGLDNSHHHRHRQHHHPSTGAIVVPHSTLTGVTVGGIGEGEISGESASSDATDSGIRQFTQQPPQPDEARHATCEIPFVYDGKFILLTYTCFPL
ncbi:unnamed protein product [Schistosoma curassoni]|uniref:Homeobox protein homothorax n=1 Tax=Schistosoma curassoni TaxID=6186 RepID=A0A183JXB8_9TREM|nr:unnamed protein product [Schistosoma curassoni]